MHNLYNFLNLNTEINSPLNQFEIRDLVSLDGPHLHLSLTNIGLFYLWVQLLYEL